MNVLEDGFSFSGWSLCVAYSDPLTNIQASPDGCMTVELADGALVKFGPGALVTHVTLNYEHAGKDGNAELINQAGTLLSAQQNDEDPANPGKTYLTVDNESCSVCLDELVDSVTLHCGHVCCSDPCFKLLCMNVANADKKQEPIRCVCEQDGGICSAVLTPEELQRLLPEETFAEVLEGSYALYIQQSPKEYGYCPTADCNFVYRKLPANNDQSGRDQARTITCTTCSFEICTKCSLQHTGMTCDNHDEATAEQELPDSFKKENGIQDCPSCGTMIQKNGGCNHMTCGVCGSHVCWVCLKYFDNGSDCMKHVNDSCGGIQNDPDGEDVPGFWVAEDDEIDFENGEFVFDNGVLEEVPWTDAERPDPAPNGMWNHHGVW